MASGTPPDSKEARMEDPREVDDKKQPYSPPQVEREEIFERTALACNQDPYLNTQTDTKDNATTCGYTDS